MSVAEVVEISRCPDCGHADYMHRETCETTRTKLDDPVPCCAAQATGVIDRHNLMTYTYCGCTTVRPFLDEGRLL